MRYTVQKKMIQGKGNASAEKQDTPFANVRASERV